jgi:hypothetical protein
VKDGTHLLRLALGWTLNMAAAAAGAWFSWGFGLAIGGWPMAALASINGALISALLVNAAFVRLWKPRS